MKLFDLTGRVALVTGGNGGIGLGMAKGLAMAGASVMIAGRDARKARGAIAELTSLGGQAEFVATDVLRQPLCDAMVAETVRRFGRLDILVNNAGTNVRKRPEALTDSDWHHVLDTNLTSQPCSFDVTASVSSGAIRNAAGISFASGDELSQATDNQVQADTLTTTTIQGVTFDTAPGVVVTLDAAMDGQEDPAFLFFVQDGKVNGGYTGTLTDPLMFEPSTP